MKNKKLIYLLGLFVFISSCSSFKLVENQEIKPLPKQYEGQQSDSLAYSPITLQSYFNDPMLLNLFKKVVLANPDYQIMQQRLMMANSHLKRAKLAFLPSLNIDLTGSGTHFGDYTMEGVGNFDTNLSSNINDDQKINRSVTPNLWLGAQVSWEIDLWGKLRNQKKAAQQRYLSSASGAILLRNQLFTDVADLYYQLIALDKKLAIYEKNFAIQQVAYDIISSQRETGKATELAVQQFGSQLKHIQADIEQMKMDIFTTEKAISALTGEYGGHVVRNTSFINSHIQLLNQAIPVDSIIHKRPDVAESYYELQASKADAKAARAAFFPTLKIGGYGAMNSFSFATFFNPASLAWQLLGGLTAPIFNQGQLKQNFYITNRQQEIAFYTYQKNVINAYNELSSLLLQVDKYQDVLRYKSEEYEMLNRAVEVANDLYLTGYANYLEIINTQKQKLQTEIDLVDYQLKNAKSFVQLYKALGGEL